MVLFVLIVNWNVCERLRACLRSLQQHASRLAEQHMVVVDNASTDGSVEMLHQEFPSTHVIANTSNRGFSGGNNDGLQYILAEVDKRHLPLRDTYILLLNPDTIVTQGAIDTLLTFIATHTDVGVAAPQLRYPDGTRQSSRRRFPTLATALFESTPLQPIAPRTVLEQYYMLDQPEDTPCDVDWVVGAAMLVRALVVTQVGGFDEENFFMYSEEVDWCRRIRRTGWRIVYYPAATVIHHEAQSSGQIVAQRLIYFNTSKVRYLAKHHGKYQAALARSALLALTAWEWMVEAGKWLVGHKRELRLARMHTYQQALRSGFR